MKRCLQKLPDYHFFRHFCGQVQKEYHKVFHTFLQYGSTVFHNDNHTHTRVYLQLWQYFLPEQFQLPIYKNLRPDGIFQVHLLRGQVLPPLKKAFFPGPVQLQFPPV